MQPLCATNPGAARDLPLLCTAGQRHPIVRPLSALSTAVAQPDLRE